MWWVLLLAIAGCRGEGDSDAGETDTDVGDTDTDVGDTDTDTGDTDTDDTDVTDVASIAEALDCGTPGEAGGLAGGTDLQRLNLDLERFPDALCNDGTGGFLYFRPYSGEANRDRWVIQLQGGGACGNAQACFDRWCSEGTNFGMQQMTADASPEYGIGDDGILSRRADNPLGDFNHVFVRYCSSDSWSGERGAIEVTAAHPLTEEEITARLHFNGADIVDAVLSTLRQDGVEAPEFTLDGGSTALPDLDDADIVVLAGASAGGSGTIRNGDRIDALLRSHNSGDLEVRLLIDSIASPSMENYGFDQTAYCTELSLCDYDAFWGYVREEGNHTFQGMIDDASCAAAHPDALHLCADNAHILRHHVTTPMFVRMGQTDSLLSENQLALGFTVDGAPLDLTTFARLVREELEALTDPGNAEEGDAMTIAPAAFGPTCSKHETISDDTSVYDVAILVDGTPTTMFDLLQAWNQGTTPAVAIANSHDENTCE